MIIITHDHCVRLEAWLDDGLGIGLSRDLRWVPFEADLFWHTDARKYVRHTTRLILLLYPRLTE